MKKIIPTLLSIIILLFGWQLIAWKIDYPAIFPSLPKLLTNVFQLFSSSEFYEAIIYTILRGLSGFILSIVIALFCSLLATFSFFWKDLLHPFVVIIRSVPVVSFVLIALIWLSPPYLPVFIAILTTFPVLYQNMLDGFVSTDYKLIEMAKVFEKKPFTIFVTLYLPSAKSLIFSGISTSMGFGWRAVIIGEVLAQPLHGIGTQMKQAQSYIEVSELIAWTFIAVLISYFFEFIIKYLSKIHYIHYSKTKIKTGNNFIPETAEIKIVTLINLTKTFNNNTIINGLTTTIKNTKINLLNQISGKGKSTLLKIISGLDSNYSGNLKIKNLSSISYAFQDKRLIPWMTAEENIRYGLRNKNNETDLTDYLLLMTGLNRDRNKYPNELSGGQQNRVNLARSLNSHADILLLDEPLTGIDEKLKINMIELIENYIAEHHPIVVWATHENLELKKFEIEILNF